MKKLSLFFVSILLCAISFAQSVPQGINYQAVARDVNGIELANQALTIQLSIISGNTTGAIVWQETHVVATNNFGLFDLIIGQGMSTNSGSSSTFNDIDWGSANHYIKVELDGAAGFSDMGTTELMSVPYALSSGTSADNSWSDDGYGNIQNINSGDVEIQADEFRVKDQWGNNKFTVNQWGEVYVGDYGSSGDFRVKDGGMDIFRVNYGNIQMDAYNIDMEGNVNIIGSEFRVRDNSWNDKFKVDYAGDVYMNGNNNYISGGLDVSGNADFHGDISGDNQPTQNEHLTRKDYVDNADAALQADVDQNEADADAAIAAEAARAQAAEVAIQAAIAAEETRAMAAEAALLDSINDLDSAIVANSLWSDDGYGNIQNINSGDIKIHTNTFAVENQNGDFKFGLNNSNFNGFLQVDCFSLFNGSVSFDNMVVMHSSLYANGNSFLHDLHVGGQSTFNDSYFLTDVYAINPPTNPDHVTNKNYVDNADAALQADVDQNEADADAAIAAEAARAQAAEVAIQAAIAAEETRAMAAEAALQANSLWSDDGSGNIQNTNSGDINIQADEFRVHDQWGNDKLVVSQWNDISIGDYGSILEIGGSAWSSESYSTTLTGDYVHIGTPDETYDLDIHGTVITIGDDYDTWQVAINSTEVSVGGDLSVTGAIFSGGVLLSSDKRFKKDITTVDNALDKVLKLRGVNYYWRQQAFPNKNFDDKLELGLIAQEVEAIIPEIVAESKDGYKAVEYQKLVALLIEAIKEQQIIIDGQKTEMADMRAELDDRLKVLEEILNTTTLNK